MGPAAGHELTALFRWKIQRPAIGVVAVTVSSLAPPTLLVFAAATLLAGPWTDIALRPIGPALFARF